MPHEDDTDTQPLLATNDPGMGDSEDILKSQADIESAPNLDNDVAAPPVLKGALDPVYEAKAQTLNAAIQDIGRLALNDNHPLSG